MIKLSKNLFSSLFSTTLFLSPLSSLAGEISTATTDLGYFVSSELTGSVNKTHLYKLESDGTANIIISNIFPDSTTSTFSATDYTVDQQKGKIYFLEPPRSGIAQRRIRVFDMETNAFEGYQNISGLPSSGSPMFIDIPVKMENLVDKKCNTTSASCGATDNKFMSLGGSGSDELIRIEDGVISTGGSNSATLVKNNNDGSVQIGADGNDIDVVEDGLNINGAAVITKNADGSIQIGADGNDIDITSEGLTVDGDSLITKKNSGEIHIGKNSLITKEEDGVQKLYAKDENGNAIDINITNDSKLLINGKEVQATNEQVTTNKNNISTNATNISTNKSNISTNTSNIATNKSNISSNAADIITLNGLLGNQKGSATTTRIGNETKNTLEIGGDTNPTTITQEGISVGGNNLIKKKSNGDIHIGKNSFVIGNDVLNGAHPIWAEDENGTKIPLNIYGSDLQINGVSVQGQIDTNKTNIKNLGSGVAGSTALTAALSALPQTSKESKLSCGVGTGAYSSRYAVGFGCASKINERVDVNAGGSYVFGGSKSYGDGTLDSGVVKAGFVFKLGELNKTTLISMKDKKKLKQEIDDLKENNERIIFQNKNLEIKNQSIIDQNKSLLARLERLEQLALGETKSKDLAIYKLK